MKIKVLTLICLLSSWTSQLFAAETKEVGDPNIFAGTINLAFYSPSALLVPQEAYADFPADPKVEFLFTTPLRPCWGLIIKHAQGVLMVHYSHNVNLNAIKRLLDGLPLSPEQKENMEVTCYTAFYDGFFALFAPGYGVINQQQVFEQKLRPFFEPYTSKGQNLRYWIADDTMLVGSGVAESIAIDRAGKLYRVQFTDPREDVLLWIRKEQIHHTLVRTTYYHDEIVKLCNKSLTLLNPEAKPSANNFDINFLRRNFMKQWNLVSIDQAYPALIQQVMKNTLDLVVDVKTKLETFRAKAGTDKRAGFIIKLCDQNETEILRLTDLCNESFYPAGQHQRCSFCHFKGPALKNCACKNARYCDRDCQGNDWKRHKAICKPVAKEPVKAND